jgi:hypothetical protein
VLANCSPPWPRRLIASHDQGRVVLAHPAAPRRLLHWRRLPPVTQHATFISVYVVTEADAAAIREAYETGGELSAAVELRRRFPGIIDNAMAREQARRIAAWTPLPYCPKPRRRIRKAPSE